MNSFGRLFRVSIYGESHGASVGVLLDGVKPGIPLKEEDFNADIERRKAGKKGTTPRVEADSVIIESGVFNGYTTGSPIMLRFINGNTKSKDYSNLLTHPRPSHADFVSNVKYNGYQDYRGGGHFSGRLTVGLVAAGVVAKKMLEGVSFYTNLINLGGCTDPKEFDNILDKVVQMKDSVGGIVSICVNGLKVGLGEPYFASIESELASAMFSLGGVKGIEFGLGFEFANRVGSTSNDEFVVEGDKIITKTNNNGGINGGISNGMDVIFNIAVKPTPSISKTQNTVDFVNKENVELNIKGRHDPAFIRRLAIVVECLTALVISDFIAIRHGTNYLKEGK